MNVNELFKKDEEITLESYLKKCNIKDIKELAVKETLILEKQKKIEFSEVAFMVLSNRK